ncbi:ATPase [Methanoculleus sp. FWC-SCC1]|uniref:ATPase n=1 Tax=Methanoculleus frigidifontis TaxID=2584085 RepID=A0ABT8M8K7_9EURY|nr:ABC-ATPase domain-containing protein [Methanoculleus sp. FWC-SCC1]MDN7024260.1 ATPase [Methanoculleus sp. FWC-SCC1]
MTAEERTQPAGDLSSTLRRIDGRGYGAYRDCRGAYAFPGYTLTINHVQADPFAAPSRVRVRVPAGTAGYPSSCTRTKGRRIALADHLARRFAAAVDARPRRQRGSGKSGSIAIARPGREILERSSVVVAADGAVEARFTVGLPARGRTVLGREAERLFFEDVPEIVRASLPYAAVDAEDLARHIRTNEDADHLRSSLDALGLVGFVADGAILPRASGVDDRPLERERAVPFASPPSLRVSVDLPHRGTLTGMGVPKGITLIVGGGFHGKSTLLAALERGVYNHVPGDGREFVVTDASAVKIRAEDGRRVENVDISPFITDLPGRPDTRSFSTENASGSTSQAANIVEALEVGASVLLIDEDTAATNMMIRDRRMQELVAGGNEPITPFIDRARPLFHDAHVSSVLVIGGSGDYFEIADTVIRLKEYLPEDVTAEARDIAARYATGRLTEGDGNFRQVRQRIPHARSIDARKGKYEAKVSAVGTRAIRFGLHEIDLSAVAQIVDPAQTAAIGRAILLARSSMDRERTLREVVAAVMDAITAGGLDVLSPYPSGDYAAFRPQELAAAISRLRSLSAGQAP